MITVVARLAELARVTGRAPAFLDVHCLFTHIVRSGVVPYRSCKSNVVDETET